MTGLQIALGGSLLGGSEHNRIGNSRNLQATQASVGRVRINQRILELVHLKIVVDFDSLQLNWSLKAAFATKKYIYHPQFFLHYVTSHSLRFEQLSFALLANLVNYQKHLKTGAGGRRILNFSET